MESDTRRLQIGHAVAHCCLPNALVARARHQFCSSLHCLPHLTRSQLGQMDAIFFAVAVSCSSTFALLQPLNASGSSSSANRFRLVTLLFFFSVSTRPIGSEAIYWPVQW